MRATPDAAEARTHLSSLVASGDVLVQPLAESVLTEGETSLIYFGGIFSHAVRKIPAGGDYRVQTNHGGRVEGHTPTAPELEVAVRALAATPKPTAYGRVDLVDVDGRPALMELEVIEPELFLSRHAQAPRRFAGHLETLLAGQPDRARS
jgi:glutathione synthase/RimK-type ligase-like ATP-grasp enzyme